MPDDATPDEIAQAVFEGHATPLGMGVAPPSGFDAREAFRQKAMAGMQDEYSSPGFTETAEPLYGGAKGLANTMIGVRELAKKIPGLRNILPEHGIDDPAVQASMVPTSFRQKAGFAGEQALEFAAPGALGKGVGSLVNVAERVKQGRTAAGLFTKATRSPVVADTIKRMLLRGGSEAAATGLLNEAQGGDFTTGAAAGAAGYGIGTAASKAAPYLKNLLRRPLTAATLGDATGITAGGAALGLGEEYLRRKYGLANLAKGALGAAALASPRTRGPIIGSFLQVFDSHEPGTVARGRGGRIGTAR